MYVFISIGQTPRSEIIAGSYDITLFTYLWNCHPILQKACAVFHSHQKCMNVQISPHLQHLLLPDFLIKAIVVHVRCFIMTVLLHITMISNDFEQFFPMLIGYLYIFLEKSLFNSVAHLLVGSYFLLLNCECSLYILVISSLTKNMICKYFIPYFGYCFHILDSVT